MNKNIICTEIAWNGKLSTRKRQFRVKYLCRGKRFRIGNFFKRNMYISAKIFWKKHSKGKHMGKVPNIIEEKIFIKNTIELKIRGRI